MSEPMEHPYIDRPCPCCGALQRVLSGLWLAEQRRLAGFAQSVVAQQAEVTQGFVSQVETGKELPSPRVLEAYKALGLTIPEDTGEESGE